MIHETDVVVCEHCKKSVLKGDTVQNLDTYWCTECNEVLIENQEWLRKSHLYGTDESNWPKGVSD